MKLDVAVASSDVLALSSSQLSLQGSADLRVVGTLGHPVILGRTTLSGGSLIFMGNVYQVQSGTVVFAIGQDGADAQYLRNNPGTAVQHHSELYRFA